MKKYFLFLLGCMLLAFTSCSDDEKNDGPMAVSFATPSQNLTENLTEVRVLFSEPAAIGGTLIINLTPTGATYGTDYITEPMAVNNVLLVPFHEGASSVSFTFVKLLDAVEGQGEVKNVVFTINSVSVDAIISGNTTTQLNFNEAPSLGNALAAVTGGPTQPNQVYVDLSSGGLATAPRVSWDLGFYGGSDFRVVLNSSLKMAAKKLGTANIDEVASEDNTMIIGQGAGNPSYIDNPVGNLDGTAIAAVSDNEAENMVYLVYMGNGPSNTPPSVGGEGSSGGDARGWKKIRVLKSGSDYKLQYADINATTHQEVTITKNSAYNFTFFSFTTNSTVNVEPQKSQWDINFTTFTNMVGPTTPYYFADFIITNTKGGARSYQVLESSISYNRFTLANVDQSLFTNDQRNIGSNWRSTSAPGPDGLPVSQFVLKTDRFFVVKDPAGNIYKLKMTGGANQSGERGYPTFQYALLR